MIFSFPDFLPELLVGNPSLSSLCFEGIVVHLQYPVGNPDELFGTSYVGKKCNLRQLNSWGRK